MALKQATGSQAPDGSLYVTLADGAGNLGALSVSATDNLTQLAGNAIDTNSGAKSAGTLRTVLATDQPQLTNALKVDGSAVTQPVSGTFWQATQPVSGTVSSNATQTGTWTVQPGNTANTTAWKVDGSAVTQPVSGTVTANAGTGTLAVSLASVPSHAVTNAGTFAVQSTAVAPAANTYIGNVNTEGTKATYGTGASGIVATAAGVLLSIQGSGTKTIRINRIRFSGSTTTAALADIGVYRTSGAVSSASGTTSLSGTKFDSNNAAATASVNSYTTSTIGASSSIITIVKTLTGTSAITPSEVEFVFGTRNSQALVLRGTGEFCQLYVSSGSYTGASFDMDIEWTEE